MKKICRHINRKNIEFAVAFGLIAAILLSFSRFGAACDDLRQNVLRLHILANSDSAEDQNLKLLVRDRILAQTGDLFGENTDLDTALTVTRQHLPEFERIARQVLAENGSSQSVNVTLEESYFETREYADFTLPAGNYRSLTVRLGEAKGHNWWCVIFPAVCVPAAGADLADGTAAYSASVASRPEKYVMRFKVTEWYEDLCRWLR